MTATPEREQQSISTIEEIVDNSAYEASMHFLYPSSHLAFGKYAVRPTMVDTLPGDSIDDSDAIQIDVDTQNGFLMWAEFYEYDVLDTFDTLKGKRYSVRKRQIGDVALATAPDILTPLSVLQETHVPTFTKLWLSHYTSDKSRNSFGLLNHPSGAFGNIRLNGDDATAEYDRPNELRIERTVRLARAVLSEQPELLDWMESIGIPTTLPQPQNRYPQDVPDWLKIDNH